MTTAIVTDSTSDLPDEYLKKYHIEVVPAMLVVEDATYLDGVGLSRDEFYQKLPSFTKPPTTSAPSIAIFQQIYQKLFSIGATEIISIHVASAFSSMYSVACLAAEDFKEKIHVIDSGQVTMGLGFQALAAAEAVARGLSIDAVINLVHSIGQRVKLIALLDTLEYVKRSGRVSWASAALTSMLNLKVLIEVKKGEIHRLGLYRNRQKGMESFITHLSNIGPLEYLAVVYTPLSNQREVQIILDKVKSQINHTPIIGPVTTVIGTHVGSNGIGFIAVSA